MQLDKEAAERDVRATGEELKLRVQQVQALGADKHDAEEVLQVVRQQVLELRAMWTRQVDDNERMQIRLACLVRMPGVLGCLQARDVGCTD